MRIAARQSHPNGSRLIQFVLPSAVTAVQPIGKFPAGCPPLIIVGLLATSYLVVQIQARVLNFDIC